jgi:adenylate kinase
MIVVVCGLSKCGKTSLVNATKSVGLDWTRVRGSQLLDVAGKPTTGLTARQTLDNQQSLRDQLARLDSHRRRLVLDGHLLIETVDGPQLVPDSAFSALDLAGVIAVAIDPNILSKRRIETALTSDPEELADLMSIEKFQARRIARQFGVPFFNVEHDDANAFTEAVAASFTSADAMRR